MTTQDEIVLKRLSIELEIEEAMKTLAATRQKMISLQAGCKHPNVRFSNFVDCKIRFCPDCGEKHVYRTEAEYP